jgi:hypothetical protein
VAASAHELHARVRFPLQSKQPFNAPVRLELGRATLPRGVELAEVGLTTAVRVQAPDLSFAPEALRLSIGRARAPEGDASGISVRARPDSMKAWNAELVGRVLDSEVALSGAADFATQKADLHLEGDLSGRILEAVNAVAHRDIRRFFSFSSAHVARAQATFGPQWKFARLTARTSLIGIDAYGVTMDDGEAMIELDPKRLYAPEAYARIGDNYARGSYEQDLATHEFRFLLDGRLRPLDISGWFRDWWPRFFKLLEFPEAPPSANVDVHGFWREGHRTSVFIYANARNAVLLGQPVASVRTRLFVRPGFYDVFELNATDPKNGRASGHFTIFSNLETGRVRSVDVSAESTVELSIISALAGEFAPIFQPFSATGVPHLAAHGHFEGLDTAARHASFDLTAETNGVLRFYELPFEDVTFSTRLRDDELTIDSTRAKFAGGAVRLHAKISGQGAERRLGFDGSLDDASLGLGIAELQRFNALRRGLPPPTPGKFVKEKANVRVDIAASADGLLGDHLTYHGGGTVVARGPEIGEVPLFGPLSELLKFTALRFTSAQTSFKLNGPRIEFPDVKLRGANSALDAHGEYALDRRQLDFRVKVFPFQESDSVLKTVVGAVLTPLSNALEVKLSGSLDNPQWAFVMGPTNLIHSLAPGTEPPATPNGPKPAEAAGPVGTPPDQPSTRPAQPPTPADKLAPKANVP